MPILDVTALPQAPGVDIGKVAATLSGAVADPLVADLGLEAGNVFVVPDELRSGRVYAGGSVLGT